MPRISSAIWVASWRVGTSTSAAGRGSLAPIRSTAGIANASAVAGAGGRFGDRVTDRGTLDRDRPRDPGSGQGAGDGAEEAEIGE
jgi:hypothetical protein